MTGLEEAVLDNLAGDDTPPDGLEPASRVQRQ